LFGFSFSKFFQIQDFVEPSSKTQKLTSLKNGLNFMKPFLSRFMGLGSFQMQKDIFQMVYEQSFTTN
jgi:hypothetical protein